MEDNQELISGLVETERKGRYPMTRLPLPSLRSAVCAASSFHPLESRVLELVFESELESFLGTIGVTSVVKLESVFFGVVASLYLMVIHLHSSCGYWVH